MLPKRRYELTDEQWDLIAPLMPKAKPGGRSNDHRTRASHSNRRRSNNSMRTTRPHLLGIYGRLHRRAKPTAGFCPAIRPQTVSIATRPSAGTRRRGGHGHVAKRVSKQNPLRADTPAFIRAAAMIRRVGHRSRTQLAASPRHAAQATISTPKP
jgi:transposase